MYISNKTKGMKINMKISSFSVKNYRSIVEARKINLKDYNVLIGKNNEGKSNILRALSVCMSCIDDYRIFRFVRGKTRYDSNYLYDWNRDFPVQLRNRKNGKNMIFRITLKLTNEEVKEFNKKIGTRLSSNDIILDIKIGPNNIPDITFHKKGTSKLTEKKKEVLDYLSNKISYNYIPSIRTPKDAIRLIRENVARELKILYNDDDYLKAIDIIKKLRKKILNGLSDNIKVELKEFLPNVKDVKIDINDDYNLGFSIRDINVMVDDGVLTEIENKGDGVNSLAVMAILKNQKSDITNAKLIMIDEPEAHLHPGAIIELSKNLKTLSNNNQVIISTHNATFVDVDEISNNIIINYGKATPAKSVSEIRNILGIQVEDYMISSRIVLLVEGKSDQKILTKILSQKSIKIKKALCSKEFTIKEVEGSSKISYTATLMQNELCKTLVMVDNDESGQQSAKHIIDNKIIDLKDVFLLKCNGMKESEIEDIINPDIYEETIYNKFGINLCRKEFKNSKKWSDRIKKCAELSGKYFDENILKEIKMTVVNIVESYEQPFIEEKISSINNLVDRLEEIIK